jgi:hypothetical protein
MAPSAVGVLTEIAAVGELAQPSSKKMRLAARGIVTRTLPIEILNSFALNQPPRRLNTNRQEGGVPWNWLRF